MNIKQCVMLNLVLLLGWTSPSQSSESIYPLITYKCDAAADVLTITNSLLTGDEGANYQYSEKDGTYSPWNMVEIATRSDSTRIIKSNKVSNVCTLSSGEYTAILEPQIFNRDLSGRCGASISGAATIVFDGFDLMERTAFEDYCHGNAPIITRITVFGKTGEYKIKRVPKFKFY